MRTCGLADLRTSERVNCGPKVADRKCGPVGKMRTLILRGMTKYITGLTGISGLTGAIVDITGR